MQSSHGTEFQRNVVKMLQIILILHVQEKTENSSNSFKQLKKLSTYAQKLKNI